MMNFRKGIINFVIIYLSLVVSDIISKAFIPLVNPLQEAKYWEYIFYNVLTDAFLLIPVGSMILLVGFYLLSKNDQSYIKQKMLVIGSFVSGVGFNIYFTLVDITSWPIVLDTQTVILNWIIMLLVPFTVFIICTKMIKRKELK